MLPVSADAFIASIDHSPIATVITDAGQPDNPIIAANAAFAALTGYAPQETMGRNCRFLAGIGTEAAAQDALRAAVTQGRATLAELTNYRKDGTAFRNAVMIAPVLENGAVRYFLGSQMEIDPASPSERQLRARTMVEGLTVRQRQVLEHMIAGYRNKQIAGFLGIDEKTVKMHRAALLARLAADTSADAIRIGVEAGVELA